MSYAESPAPTDAEKILAALDDLSNRVDAQRDAVNGLGQNVQWVIEQAQGIFQMFSNPQFMSKVLSGGIPGAGGNAVPGNAESESIGNG